MFYSNNNGVLIIIIIKSICLLVDPRVRGWLLLDSCTPTLVLTFIYLLIVYIGPKYMKDKPAYSLKNVLLLYNFGVTMLSFYMLVEVRERDRAKNPKIIKDENATRSTRMNKRTRAVTLVLVGRGLRTSKPSIRRVPP